jgi:ribose 5-phosphate isomerase B
LPSRFLSPEDAEKILDVFLSTDFEGGRHVRRVEKIETKEHGE